MYIATEIMEISSTIYKTPLGSLKLEATAEGICGVKWLFGKHSKSQSGHLSTTQEIQKREGGCKNSSAPAAIDKPISDTTKADEHLKICRAWLDAYFSGTLLQTSPPKPALVLPESGGSSNNLFSFFFLIKHATYAD